MSDDPQMSDDPLDDMIGVDLDGWTDASRDGWRGERFVRVISANTSLEVQATTDLAGQGIYRWRSVTLFAGATEWNGSWPRLIDAMAAAEASCR